MTTIEYNTEKIHVPESWADVTLGLYENICFVKPETHRDRVDLVAKICGTEAETLLNWPAEIFNHIVALLGFIFGDNPTPPTANTEINGVIYTVAIEEALTLGEWIDAEEVQKSGKDIISGVLAIVCRPAGEAYDAGIAEERREMFKAATMDKILGVMAFFLQCKRVLEKHTQVSTLLLEAVARLPRFTAIFRPRGAGIRLSRILPAVRFLILTLLLRYQLHRYLHSCNMKKINRPRKKRKTI